MLKENFSWKTVDENKIKKELDFSSFAYRQTAIPKDFYNFFNININDKNDKHIILKNNNKEYYASIKWTRPVSPVARLFFSKDFLDTLKNYFSEWSSIAKGEKNSNMDLFFEATAQENIFNVSFKDKIMFGHIPGFLIGHVFKSRKDLNESDLHKPLIAGISGSKNGAYSIVLSGGYKDDVDNLDHIIYTGQGGRDNITGKQISDQVFERGNLGLKLSCEYRKPVRVIRGYQISNGPSNGYRYDGLYYVIRYERVKNIDGLYICRFYLKRDSFEEVLSECNPNQFEKYMQTARREINTYEVIRDIKITEKIKLIYSNKCQICNIYLKKPFGAISIGAHIKPLGWPHDGPDSLDNMLCLCPNHHDQFDAFSFYIDPNDFSVRGLDGYEGDIINIDKKKHNINREFFEYHKREYEKNNEYMEV